MENLFSSISVFLFVLIDIVIIAGITKKLIDNRFSKEREVAATVVNKQSFDRQIFRKSQASFTKKEYIITFQCGNNKRHFAVSELSYKNYKVNQSGVLRYKGNRLIDFDRRQK